MTLYGIDLGLGCARVAWLDPAGGGVQVGVPRDGSPVLAAAVAFRGPDDVVVGREALDCELPEQKLRVRRVRRLLEEPDRPESTVRAHGKTHHPDAVVGLLLQELMHQADSAADEMNDEAIVGAPVDFDLAAQDLLFRAAERGKPELYVSRLVCEPVAVAAHYGLLDGGTHHVVVCDLGGTRLEVSALAISFGDVRIVHAVCRDVEGDPDGVGLAAAAVNETADAARAAGMPQVRTVLLAGGGLREPAAAAELRARLGGFEVRAEEPDVAVVKGLVRYAGVGMLTVDNQWLDERRGVPRSPLARGFDDPDDEPAPAAPAAATPPPPPPTLNVPPPPTINVPPPAAAPPPPPPPPPAPSSRVTEHRAAAKAERAPERPRAAEFERVPEEAASAPRPVHHLHAERREGEVHVTFGWPDGAHTARVTWRIGSAGAGGRSGEVTCTPHTYRHGGGVVLRTGPGDVEIEAVCLVPGASGHEPPARLTLSALRPAVRYLPELVGKLRPAVRITLTSERDCMLPELLVVLAHTRHQPVHPSEGEVVHRVASRRLAPGGAEPVEFPVGRLASPSWIVCFPADPDATEVDLLPLSLNRLKVR